MMIGIFVLFAVLATVAVIAGYYWTAVCIFIFAAFAAALVVVFFVAATDQAKEMEADEFDDRYIDRGRKQ